MSKYLKINTNKYNHLSVQENIKNKWQINVFIIWLNGYLQSICYKQSVLIATCTSSHLYHLITLHVYLLHITNIFIAFHRNYTDWMIEINLLDSTIVNRYTHFYLNNINNFEIFVRCMFS